MDHLYAPWRNQYIRNYEKPTGCFFCESLKQTEDSAGNLVVHRGDHAFVILNRFPYTNAHMMIAPVDHIGKLELLDKPVRSEIMELITRGVQVLDQLYHPEGYNIGSNIGFVAGAGMPDHLHFHVLPRWGGDTNFMSTVANARVLPETLEETWLRVSMAWKQLA